METKFKSIMNLDNHINQILRKYASNYTAKCATHETRMKRHKFRAKISARFNNNSSIHVIFVSNSHTFFTHVVWNFSTF